MQNYDNFVALAYSCSLVEELKAEELLLLWYMVAASKGNLGIGL
jgi:hypothetical protein